MNSNKIGLAKAILFFPVFLRFVLPGWGMQPKPAEADIDKGFHLYASFKYVKNYAPQTYDLLSQNWCILQDGRGVIYAANQGGILEFDGATWRIIEIPNEFVRSMDIAPDGTIYIGGRNELGYLAGDGSGTVRYVSLSKHLKDNQRDFSAVYQVHCTADATWFRTNRSLLRWHAGEFTEPKPSQGEYWFNAVFTWNDNLYVQEKTVGLNQVTGDSFRPIPGSKTFGAGKIYMAVPYDDRRLLIGTLRGGFYLYDGTEAKPFRTEVDAYLENHMLYHGIRLRSGDFALATLSGGLVIIDAGGHFKGLYNKNSGLQDDSIKYVFEDICGNLWLGLNKGIAKIEYGSPIYFFGDHSGLKGVVISVIRHKGRLFVGTSGGLYYLESPSSIQEDAKPPVFRPVAGIFGSSWSLLSIGDSLLAAASRGTFLVEDNDVKRIRPVEPGIPCFALAASKTIRGRVWVAADRELMAFRYNNTDTNHQWQKEDRSINIQGVRSIVEDAAGNLWLGTLTKGVFRVEFPGDKGEPGIKNYGTEHMLPAGEVYVARAAGHIMFATSSGVFRFDEARKYFVPDLTLGKEFAGGSQEVFRLAEDRNRHIWFYSAGKNFHAEPGSDGTFNIDGTSLRRVPHTQVHNIYPDRYRQKQVVWFATNDGLVGFDADAAVKKDYKQPFSVLIRKASIIGGSTVYGGIKTSEDETAALPVFNYKERNLHIEAGAPFFENESKTLYRFFMDGLDKNWSKWTRVAFKDYTNLDAGQYTLRVQAKNVYETISREDTFSFEVLLPWYRTWWAFSLFAMTAFLMVYLMVKWWRSRKLALEKQRLERIVEERTREINQANIQLQQKTIQLEEQSEKLKEMDKIKSRFFANISHEFRTPLTLIMGPLDQIRSDRLDKYRDRDKDKGIEKRIDLAYRSAQRLLGLINQLLDLSKLESGKMKLQAEQRDLVPFLKGILEPFKLAAARHHLNLIFHAAEGSILLYFDPEKLENVMGNLLSNAVKFTPRGGSITVSVSRGKGNDYVHISVKDTGIGIPENQLAYIFERFYQAETTMEHQHKGSGIGLALSKELVELHHGEMTVISTRKKENRGTEFILRFPLGSDHLGPEEMVESHPRSVDEHEQEEHEFSAVEAIGPLEHIGDAIDTTKDNGIECLLAAETRAQAPKKDIILVVEDNADLRYYIRTSLEPDYTVVEAKDGRMGIEKAKSVIPDLIISDIMMPGVDGYELCRAVKTDICTSHIPVVLLTAKAAEEDIVRGLELGADDYVTKPFNTRLLCARIKNLIDLRRQLQSKLNREMVFQPSRLAFSDIDREFLNDLQEVIEANLSDPDLNVEMLSKRLYMSRTTLYRKIQALSGEAPTDFIRSYRLMRAVQLLKSDFGSITEVAFEVGFSSRAYFTKCFKEKFHLLPSEYIQSESKPS